MDVAAHASQDGVTALHIASYKGQSRIVRDLCVNKDREKVNILVNLQDEVMSFASLTVAYSMVSFRMD